MIFDVCGSEIPEPGHCAAETFLEGDIASLKPVELAAQTAYAFLGFPEAPAELGVSNWRTG